MREHCSAPTQTLYRKPFPACGGSVLRKGLSKGPLQGAPLQHHMAVLLIVGEPPLPGWPSGQQHGTVERNSKAVSKACWKLPGGEGAAPRISRGPAPVEEFPPRNSAV